MRLTCIIISLSLLAYVVVRAIVVPFTVDEAWTFVEFTNGEFWNVVSYAHPVPNNHILNSLLTKPFAAISTSELSLRFPNILAFILYLYAAWQIAVVLFTNKVSRISLFIALMLNISLIHFFALCRGYGISIGLLLFSIYYLLLLAKSYRPQHAHICLLAALLSVYASFTVMHAFLSICIIVFFIGYSRSPGGIKSFFSALKIPSLYIALAAILCTYPIKQAWRWDLLTYGGTNGFIDDTLHTVLINLLGGDTAHAHKIFVLTIAITLLLAVLVIVIYKAFPGKKRYSAAFIVPFILFFSILLINLQFYLLGTRFVIYRTAMYLYPLIILSIFSAAALFRERYLIFTKTVMLILTGILFYFFITQAGFTIKGEWGFEAHNKKVLSYIGKRVPAGKKAKIFVFHLSSNSFNYYISRKYGDKLEPTDNIGDTSTVDLNRYDYIYVPATYDLSGYSDFKIVQSYDSGAYLLYAKGM